MPTASRFVFVLDGVQVEAAPGQTILLAADAAGIYIPRLCHLTGLSPFGSCRVCTVLIDGRYGTACTTPAGSEMVVESDTAELRAVRRELIEMLFMEGNHLCMYCEASGRCELQALAYRFDMRVPQQPPRFPALNIDASHPQILLDRTRCILCARCVRSAREVDGKEALGFVNRGRAKRLAASARQGLVGTALTGSDQAIFACPTGALLPKHRGFDIPVGRRPYDEQPIGAAIEARRAREAGDAEL